jgi:hypothetical protein
LFSQSSCLRKTAPLAALAVVITAMPLWLARAGLRAYFTGDDMMNLYGCWIKPWGDLLFANVMYWSPFYRPAGGLFYRGIFALFGFDPLPFRIACYGIMIVNLVLLYALARRLSGSYGTGLLAALVASYHGYFIDLYYNTGTIYDLACFLFYAGALVVYVRGRAEGRPLSLRRSCAVAVLFVCALNSKEMAVTLPLAIALYEFIWFPPPGAGLIAWSRRLGLAALLAVAAVPYVYGKLSARSAFAGVADYTPHFGFGAYLTNYGHYLDSMFYRKQDWFTNTRVLELFLAMALIAAISRRKELWFGWAFAAFSVLPVIFIPLRGTIFVLYVPFIGWALYVAGLLSWLQSLVLNAVRPARVRQTLAGVTFLGFAIWLALLHHRHTPVVHSDPMVQDADRQIHRLVPSLAPNSRVLFLDDPFSPDEWTLMFLLRLSYRNPTVQVDRVKMMPAPPSAAVVATYDVILTCVNGKYSRLTYPLGFNVPQVEIRASGGPLPLVAAQ